MIGGLCPGPAFPSSLCEDCKAWCDRLAGRDLLDEAPFRPVRPKTVELRENKSAASPRHWFGARRYPATIRSLRDLVEIETYRDGLRFFIERKGNEFTTAIFALAGALTAIARHHLGLDKAHLDCMAAINRKLDVGTRD